MTPPRQPGPSPTLRDRRKAFSLLLIPSYILVCAALYLVDGTVSFTDPTTLLLLNTAFLGLTPLYVAYVSNTVFRRSGPVSVLMMGAGMLFLGLGSIAAGLAGFLPDSTNLSVTIFNVGACAGAVLQSAGALTTLAGWREDRPERRPAAAATAYAAVVLAVAGLVAAALLGLTPVFFVPGTGSTVVRDLVLATAVEFFLLAAVLFLALYRRRREEFFFWYAVGMAVLGLGLIAAVLITVFGGPLNWAARIGQYLGALYILAAFLALERRATSGNIPVQEMLARFFGEAEAGYRQLVETAADAIVVLDPEYRVLLWNTAAERIFGYARDEAVGLAFPALVLAGGDPSALAETAGGARELEARQRSGARVPVELTVARREIGGQAITTCIIRDLSEQKRAEAALRESEARFRLALTNAPTVLFAQDRELRYTWTSNPHEGFAGTKTLGRTDLDLLPPEDAEPLTALKRRVLETGTGLRAEVRTTIGGVPYFYDLSLEPLADERGETVGVRGISHDITGLKRAEEALREAEARLARAQEIAHVGSWSWDVASDTLSWSDETYRILGLEPGAIATPRNEDFLAFVHPDDRERVAAAIQHALVSGQYNVEFRFVRRDGGEVYAHSQAAVTFADGTPVRMEGAVQDVTERREAEEALRSYAADLQRSNEDLERFAYVSSHDLQEPLRSIVSFSQLLERRYRGKLGADADEYIGFIVEGGNRMQSLIQDLLAYSRVNTTRQELAPTDTAAVLASTERSLDVQLREAGGVITHDPMPMVLADPIQLEQVFANLVSNAIKFRRPDEPLRIHVGARRLDGYWEFSVADNGIGIDPEYFDRIFVIFQRLHTKDQYEGTGIGLAIIKRIIDRHGGSIRVESVPGEGSTFFFTLPAA